MVCSLGELRVAKLPFDCLSYAEILGPSQRPNQNSAAQGNPAQGNPLDARSLRT
jgi:hypothetical protein